MAGARGGGGREQMKKWRPVMLAGASGPVETPHSHQVLPSASREAKHQLKKIVPSGGLC